MKLLMEPIEVQAAAQKPTGFRWRGRWYRVREISQEWSYRGRWWTDPDLRGERRRYYRVVASRETGGGSWRAGGTSGAGGEHPGAAGFEIFEREGQWVLSRLLD